MKIYLILITTIIIIITRLEGTLSVSSNNNVYRFEPIQILEEPPIGTLIIDLASKLEINDLATSDYKFRFYSPHSLTAHYFLIDQLTGHVKTQRSLDREYLCETKACGPCTNTNLNCTLPIEIVAQQTNSFKQQKFVSFDVIIEDKNEFAPKFPRESIVLNISENAPVNFTVPIDAAIDRDSKQSKIIYKLMPISNDENENDDENENEIEVLQSKVHLSFANNPQQQLSLTILKPFDYESEKELRFKILASDSAASNSEQQQVLTGVCYITIKIIDLNDNIPQFDKQEYEYRLDEDKAQSGTKLIRVHATDKDDGLNGLVKYYFVDQLVSLTNPLVQQQQQQLPQQQQTTNSIRNIFQLDELTGWISVSPNWPAGLDYEQAPVYRLTVRAQDSGISNSIPVYAQVNIYLNDINDNPPHISLTVPSTLDDFSTGQQTSAAATTISPINQLEISEWTPVEQFLAQIVINDLDSGLNGKLRIEMSQTKKKTGAVIWQPAEDFVLVHLFNNIYSLMTKHLLNRESFDLYSLNITVSDSGQPFSLTTVHKLLIKIKDENDNSPVFTPIVDSNSLITKLDKNGTVITYEFYLNESTTTTLDWIQIGLVKAIDHDINENAKIKYELSGGNLTNLFKIDSETGLISAKQSAIDHELAESYELKVIASDSLNQASANLLIKILDLNDNRPVFEHHTYKFKVKESDPSMTRLGQVKAYDLDKLGTNYSTIKYSIIEQINKENTNKFRINELTGDLYLQSELDYEKVTSYEFKVSATDGAQLSAILPCSIQIEVIDVNDNRPKLVAPTDLSMPLMFPIENINNKPYMLFTVNATDLDKSNVLFGRLRYMLEDEVQIINQSNDLLSNQETITDLFECDSNNGQIKLKLSDYDLNEIMGVYALVIKISDFGGLTTNAYIFLALTNKTQLNDTNYMQRIQRISQLVNEANLNENNINKKNDENALNELKFRRLVKYLNSPQSSDYYNDEKNSDLQHSQSQLSILKNQIIQAFNGKNYKYFLVFIIVAAVMIVFILISLAMSIFFYRKYNDNNTSINSNGKNKNKSSLISPTSYGVIINNNAGSASPSSSITSSELIDNSHFLNTSTTNSDEPKFEKKHKNMSTTITTTTTSNPNSKGKRVNIYSKKSDYYYDYECEGEEEEDDDEDGFGHIKKMANLKTESSNGLSTKSPSQQSSTASLIRINRFKKSSSGINQKSRLNKSTNQQTKTNENSSLLSKQIYDSNNLNTSGEVDEQRSILMLNTNSPTATSSSSSSSSSSGIISSTLSSAQQLLVLAPSSSSGTSNSNKHKMVASTESLESSLNESQTNANKTETSISNQQSSRSSTTSQEASTQQQQHSTTNNSASPNSFRTFKINYSSPNRQNLQSIVAQNNNYRTMPSKPLNNNNCDLKPLNLPVNELFKRYELKKQAESGLTSTCSNSSLNSIPQAINNNQRKIVEINIKNINKISSSPHFVQKQLINNNNQEVPDYFFKDEKEYKKFLASQTNKLNCKHIIETAE